MWLWILFGLYILYTEYRWYCARQISKTGLEAFEYSIKRFDRIDRLAKIDSRKGLPF